MSIPINGNRNTFGIGFTPAQHNQGAKGTNEIKNNFPINFTSTNSVGRTDLDANVANVSNRAQINAPTAQGLASAEAVLEGNLISGYHFDSLGPCDTKVFAMRYNSANAPRIADGTKSACESFEYTQVAGNLQSSNSPFAELFS